MIPCKVKTINGYQTRFAFEYGKDDIDLSSFQPKKIQNKKVKNKSKYINIFGTFDIETTTFEYGIKSDGEPDYQALMYQWQFALSKEFVVFGRTWQELLDFLDDLKYDFQLGQESKMVVYIHNLSFEYQFMKAYLQFNDVFATAPHKVIKACTEAFEFRCSYILTNMSLMKFLENEKSELQKGVDDLDYRVFRDSESILTDIENGYCYNDVAGLHEGITNLMVKEKDSLFTIPLTSTGYVRRDVRRECDSTYYRNKYIDNAILDDYHYTLLKEAFRGGNTACNVRYTDRILDNVISYDFSSSYPSRMIVDYYPIGKWCDVVINSKEIFEKYLKKYCCLMRLTFENIKLKDNVDIAYIPRSKCRFDINSNVDVFNGRVIKAEYLEITVTEIDLEIIKEQYTFDTMTLTDNVISISKRGLLPKEIRKKVVEYFTKKTELKGVDDYFYMKFKNKLNAMYGMCVTDIAFKHFTENNGEWIVEHVDVERALNDYFESKKTFLQYAWGVWITAHARLALENLIKCFNGKVIYVDTDSVKVCESKEKAEEKIKKLNDKFIERISKSDMSLVAIDRKGGTHTLGLAELDGVYTQFKTLGAKKYVYIDENGLHITISGVPKKTGAKYLDMHGGINAFKKGFVFEKIKNGLQYNENLGLINYNGKCYNITSNIAIYSVDYSTNYVFDLNSIMRMIYRCSEVEYE